MDNDYSQRQLRAGELIKKALVEIFLKGQVLDATVPENSLTISRVTMTPDLRYATIYFIPFGQNIDSKVLLEGLVNMTHLLRKMLAKKVNLKFLPELIFKLDNSMYKAREIDEALKNIEYSTEC